MSVSNYMIRVEDARKGISPFQPAGDKGGFSSSFYNLEGTSN